MPDTSAVLADRYVLGKVIARGGMADVWTARDDVLARTVAVKVLKANLAGDATFVERFKREALAAARLAHPNIVAIYDTGSEMVSGVERHYIVMEHCGNGTLRTLLADIPVTPERAVALLEPICDALTYAHGQGIVHRDLKPENVLVSHQQTLKVADFGIAKAAFASGDITTTGTIIGTVTYISPEQAKGVEPDHRSDIYSLGVVLYEALVGRPPFKEETDVATALAHLNNEPPPLRSIKAGIPRTLDTAVLKALAKEPEDRYSSTDELRAALAGALDSGGTQVLRVPQRRAPVASPGEQRARTRSFPWLALGAILLGVILLFAALTAGGDDEQPGPGGGGGQNNESDEGPGAAAGIDVQEVRDFDPHGDGVEHPDEVELVVDGSRTTAWRSETYQDTLSLIKPGVGLVFDLGDDAEVDEVVIDLGGPGYDLELRAGSEVGDDETSLEVIATVSGSETAERLSFEPVSARYWLVWITGLPGGSGGSAAINEVRFIGP